VPQTSSHVGINIITTNKVANHVYVNCAVTTYVINNLLLADSES